LRHRPFIEKSPDRRPVSLISHKFLDLIEIAWISGMNRSKEDARPKTLVLPPRFKYCFCHHHTRAPLRTKVEIQDDVFDSPFDRELDCFLWRHRTEQFGGRPAR